jgi:hypothetical protein
LSAPQRRPRRPRRPSAVKEYLDAWTKLVHLAESAAPTAPFECECPACGGYFGLEARDRLEAVIRRGGRRGRRVSAAVRPLDARFEAATVPTWSLSPGDGWWHGRSWDD